MQTKQLRLKKEDNAGKMWLKKLKNCDCDDPTALYIPDCPECKGAKRC